MIDFIIKGNPKSKGRPVFSTKGGKIRAYTSKKTSSFENLVKLRAQKVIEKPFKKGVGLSIKFYLSRPKRLIWKTKPMPLIFCYRRPDIDNLVKAIVDGLNGIAFKDDAQIVKLYCEKYYHSGDGSPQTTISIWEEEDST